MWAFIVVPFFEGTGDSIKLDLSTKGEKTVNVQLQNGDAYIVCCKHHKKNKTKCRSNSTNCALHCHEHMLLTVEASLDKIQVVVILYIIPDQEDLEPPINNEDIMEQFMENIFCTPTSYSNNMTMREMVCVF